MINFAENNDASFDPLKSFIFLAVVVLAVRICEAWISSKWLNHDGSSSADGLVNIGWTPVLVLRQPLPQSNITALSDAALVIRPLPSCSASYSSNVKQAVRLMVLSSRWFPCSTHWCLINSHLLDSALYSTVAVKMASRIQPLQWEMQI